MKDYKKTATEVLRLVGGEKNVSHLEHCSTRLRFTLVDPGKADQAALKKTPGVMGVVASGPQCQVVIGNDVIEVYDEIMKMAKFFGITLQNVNYTGQVFPAILAVAFMALIEKQFTKVCPKPIRVFAVPMVCFGVTFPIALLVLGPLGYNIGSLLTTVILWLYDTLGWLAVGILAAILPFMIATGMHKALVPYAVASISSPGFEVLYLPASLGHNISEGGACLAVAVRTKDEELRSAAISAGITGVKAFVAMGPGIAGMPMFLDPENGMNLVWACVGLVIALVVSFVATFFLYKDETPAVEETPTAAGAGAVATGAVSASSGSLVSPLRGLAIPLDQVKDEVFATGVLGEGIAIIPSVGELYAPADGTIDTVFDSKHAISMVADNGAEILMHVGMDTVQLKGKGYNPLVKNGDKVKKGQLIMKFDLEAIKAAGFETATPVVITNGDDFKVKPAPGGDVKPGDKIMDLEVGS